MSTAATVSDASLVSAAGRTGRGTVVSWPFDLAFFVLPPAGTALFLAAQHFAPGQAFALCALIWVGLAQSHFGATLLFFLDPASLAHYRRSPVVYFVVPAAIILGYLALGFTRFASLALLAVPIGSFWHGNKQSVGVCGLYRGLTRNFDAQSRHLELVAIFAGSACFTAVGLLRLNIFAAIGLHFTQVPPLLLRLWWLALGGAFALLVAAELRAFRQNTAAGVKPWPRMAVLLSSWAMYAPYVLARDALSAYLAALIPHYLQYHGLLYLLNRNKVRDEPEGSGRWLRRIVASPQRYAAATIGFGLFLGVVLLAARGVGRIEAGLTVVAGINLAHFWLDGFFWRFRDPQARKATLRHIHA